MNKKFISIIFIFTLILSVQANAFFFFGYYGSFDDSNPNKNPKTGETIVDFNGGENSVDFNGGEDPIDFIGGENLVDFNGGENLVDFNNKNDFVNIGDVPVDTPIFNDPFDGINSPDYPVPGDLPIDKPINLPAEWKKLSDVLITQGIADNTIIYANIKAQCVDPDDPETFKIVSKHKYYDLFFSGDNLAIKNLNPDYLGKEDVIISCNGVKEDFKLTVAEKGNVPASWLPLNDVVIDYSTPDNTIIYHNIVSKCIDPDDDRVIEIVPRSNFDLFFKGYDLLIKNIRGLNPYESSVFRIWVSCNDVFSSFRLTISPVDQADYVIEDKDKEAESDIAMSSIFIPFPDAVHAGDSIPINLVFKNKGDETLEDIKATAIIAELGARAAEGPFDLKKGKKESRTLFLEIPEFTVPGTYYVRLSVDDRIKYREINVIE